MCRKPTFQFSRRIGICIMRHLFLEGRDNTHNVIIKENSVENIINESRDFNSNAATSPVHIGELIRAKESQKQFYHSLELVAPRGEDHAYKRFFEETTSEVMPLFYSLTWHEKSGNKFFPLQLIPQFPKNTLLHLSAQGLNRKDVEQILEKVLDLGITNLFVVRGDHPTQDADFRYAINLIEFIRNLYGDKFCIAVAGYPDTHPESPSKESDLYYLKKKVDAGADFIITQILFESQRFIEFVKDCKSCGIDVPIVPGIFPISNYRTFGKLEKICSLTIPKKIHEDLLKIKDKDDEVQTYGISLATRVAKEILASGVVHGCHLFTLNNFSITREISSNIIPKPSP